MVEVRDQQVEPAVAVDVFRVGGHRPGHPPGGIERHLGLEADLAEAPVARVPEEEVRRRVVRLEHVDPAVVVEIGGDDGHALPDQARDAGRRARVLERPVALVAEEDARLPTNLAIVQNG